MGARGESIKVYELSHLLRLRRAGGHALAGARAAAAASALVARALINRTDKSTFAFAFVARSVFRFALVPNPKTAHKQTDARAA